MIHTDGFTIRVWTKSPEIGQTQPADLGTLRVPLCHRHRAPVANEVAVAFDMMSCAELCKKSAKASGANLSSINVTHRMRCLVPVVLAALGLNSPAWSGQVTIKSINVVQVSESATRNGPGSYQRGDKHSIKCNRTECIGIIPIILPWGTYKYQAVIVTLTSDPQFIGLRVNLHPADTGCGSRCEEPSLHSISASVPWIGQRHVTIPISQSGDFPPTTSPDSTTDLVYRLHPKPVACFDLSVEFE